MLADYLKAAIPTPTTILGQQLRPFSLGHNLLLLRHESGFLTGKGIAAGDLELAIFICCQTYEEATEALQSPELNKLLKQWSKRVGKFDYLEKCRMFGRYLREGSAMPELLDDEQGKESRTPGAPFLQIVKVTLQGELGCSRSEALNMPLGEALHDYFAHYERKGRIKIIGPDEKAHVESIAEIRKLIFQEKGWHAL